MNNYEGNFESTEKFDPNGDNNKFFEEFLVAEKKSLNKSTLDIKKSYPGFQPLRNLFSKDSFKSNEKKIEMKDKPKKILPGDTSERSVMENFVGYRKNTITGIKRKNIEPSNEPVKKQRLI